jgi:hypothetical protein
VSQGSPALRPGRFSMQLAGRSKVGREIVVSNDFGSLGLSGRAQGSGRFRGADQAPSTGQVPGTKSPSSNSAEYRRHS